MYSLYIKNIYFTLVPILFFLSFNVNANNIKNSAVIFMYHRFGEDNYPSTNITIKQFEQHLEEFSKPKYNVLPLELIIETFEAGGDLPENTISITVDDAYRSILTQAWPRMKKYNFPLTIFVSTEPVDAKMGNYLNWEEIRELMSEGVAIGAHTRTHPHLHELSVSEIKEEIECFIWGVVTYIIHDTITS